MLFFALLTSDEGEGGVDGACNFGGFQETGLLTKLSSEVVMISNS
jgi:hypothetical protein